MTTPTIRLAILAAILSSACAGTQVGHPEAPDGGRPDGSAESCAALLPAADAGVTPHRITVTTKIQRELSDTFWRPDIKAYPYNEDGSIPGTAVLISEERSMADGGETELTTLEYPYGFAPSSGLNYGYISATEGIRLNTGGMLISYDNLLHDLGEDAERETVALNIKAETSLWPAPHLAFTRIEATLPDGGVLAAQESGMRLGPLAGPGGIDELVPIIVTAEAPASVRYARGSFEANGRPYRAGAASIDTNGQTTYWRQKVYAYRSDLIPSWVGHIAEGPWRKTDGGTANQVVFGMFELGPVLAKTGLCPAEIAGLRLTVQMSATDPIPVLSGEAVLVSGKTVAL